MLSYFNILGKQIYEHAGIRLPVFDFGLIWIKLDVQVFFNRKGHKGFTRFTTLCDLCVLCEK